MPVAGVFLLSLITCSGSVTAVFGPGYGVVVVVTFLVLLGVFVLNSLVTWLLLPRYSQDGTSENTGESASENRTD
jgi:hypothetical protein